MAEKDYFNTEQFIAEIMFRPAIWDTSSDNYTNRVLKRAAWDELIEIFAKKGDSLENKIEFGRSLQRKWKSLRDCYSRERKRVERLENGTAVYRKTQYMFYHHLNFLSDVVKPKPLTSPEEDNTEECFETVMVDGFDEDIYDYESATTEQSQPSASARPAKMQRVAQTPSDEVSRLIDVIQANIVSQQEMERSREEDDDRLFLLSLLNPMKRLPDHVRFSVRTQFSQIMENALKCLQDSSVSNSPENEDSAISNKSTLARGRSRASTSRSKAS